MKLANSFRVNPIVPAGRDLLRLSAHSNLLELGHQQSAKQIGVFNGQEVPLALARKILPLSMMWAKSKRFSGWETMWRIGFWARNVSASSISSRWTCCRTNVESFSASNTPLRNPSLISEFVAKGRFDQKPAQVAMVPRRSLSRNARMAFCNTLFIWSPR